MKKLGTVALVVCGVLVISQSLALLFTISAYALQFYEMAQDGDGVKAKAFVIMLGPLACALGIGLGLTLILGRRRLADMLFDDAEIDLISDGASALKLFLILAGVVSVLVGLIGGITWAFRWVGEFMAAAALGGSAEQPPLSGWLYSLSRVIGEIVLGAALIAWADTLAGRLWNGSRPRPGTEDLPTCPSCGTAYDPADYIDPSTALCSECRQPLSGDTAS